MPILISADLPLEFDVRLPRTRDALAFAQRAHAGQRREADGAPFIVHPLEVAMLLYEAGAADEVIAAGVLHDTLEKTDATVYELHARFGPRVCEIVCAETDDPRIAGYARRKAELREQVSRAGQDALMVFAADKVSKVRELALGEGPPIKVRSQRLRHYRQCLAMLQRRLPHSPLVAALAAELEAPSAGTALAGAG